RVSRCAGSAFGFLLLTLAGLGVLGFGLRLLGAVEFRKQKPTATSTALPEVADANALYAQSCSAAERGAYREAASKLFLAALSVIDSRGLVGARPSRTVGELRRELRPSPLAPDFEIIARSFTSAVYAEHTVAREDWLYAHDAYMHLQAGAAH
ncbi:MAG: hypothetical protein M3Y21_05245, partial [Candidatus Eremiobacteraeota bacterium]|nr:hypothetical protein [Candidatus Eremiobacteraeota bacterium]